MLVDLDKKVQTSLASASDKSYVKIINTRIADACLKLLTIKTCGTGCLPLSRVHCDDFFCCYKTDKKSSVYLDVPSIRMTDVRPNSNIQHRTVFHSGGTDEPRGPNLNLGGKIVNFFLQMFVLVGVNLLEI